jgi:hypothetical protein
VTRRPVVLAAAVALAAIAPTASSGGGPASGSSLASAEIATAGTRALRDCPVVSVRRIVSVIGRLRTNPAPVFHAFTFRDRREYECEVSNSRIGNGALWVRIDAFCASPQRNLERYGASWNMARRDASPRRLSGLGRAAFTMNFAGIRWLYMLTDHAFTTVRMMQGGTKPGPFALTLALGRAAVGFDCRVRR